MLAHIRERRKTGSDSTAFRESGLVRTNETDYNHLCPAIAQLSPSRDLTLWPGASLSSPMPIIKRKRIAGGFTNIPNDLLGNPKVSFKAKGILAYLLSKPDDWTIRIKDIQNHGKEGEDAVQTALRELEAAGYASLFRGGRISGSYWEVYDHPSMKSDKPKTASSVGERQAENPTVAKPDSRIIGSPTNTESLVITESVPITDSPLNGECEVNGKETRTGKKSDSDQRLDPQRKRGAPSGSQPPSSAQPPSLHKEFIALFCDLYKERTGKNYLVQSGKDGSAVKRLTGGLGSDALVALREAHDSYPKMTPFLQGAVNSIATFVGRINEIRAFKESKPVWKQLEELKAKIDQHPANPKSAWENPNATPEQKKDYRDSYARYRALGGTEDL